MDTHLIISLVAKAPFPGRRGPRERHDWFRTAALAADLYRTVPRSRVAVVTGLVVDGIAEADVYVEALAELGVADPIVVRDGYETIRQIEIATALARECGAAVGFVSTHLHRPRVERYAPAARHWSAGGERHPHETLKDVLAIPFALAVDALGLRDRYLALVERRRRRGILVYG